MADDESGAQAELALFVLVGVISIYPTIRFIGWRRRTDQGGALAVAEQECGRITLALRAEMAVLVVMVLCASLMARGITP